MLRGEHFRLFAFKQRRAGFGFGEFVELEFLEPHVFFEPHLEPAHRGDQSAEADEARAGLAGQRIGVAGHDKTRAAGSQQRQQIHQPVFLRASFHQFREFGS